MRKYIRNPIDKPCSCCGAMTHFKSRLGRTCDACKKINYDRAQLNSRNARKQVKKKYVGYESVSKAAGKPIRRATKLEPELETDMCRGAIERFCTVLDIKPSGPVRHIVPGSPEFDRLARMYGAPR